MPSVKALAAQAGAVRRWWGWGLGWVMNRRPAFARDLEMNDDEAAALGCHCRGHVGATSSTGSGPARAASSAATASRSPPTTSATTPSATPTTSTMATPPPPPGRSPDPISPAKNRS
ncbi:hypothetical protein OsJ_27901 [Oryza sativa Japonica Group]|uniref:Uncharacterized protein n=1 Tax=Oryza sativa subsp. japonica TaxID=39947 RepID=A3BUR6_ORYSJ|nr:hypothetical protein OsJ_27901 [Oryza sativa Japonica Group]